MQGITTMLEDFFYLILCIVLYQYRIWYQALAWYLLNNAILNAGCTFIPGGSSNLAALHLIIHSTLNGPTYQGQSFPGLSFSFRCFIDSSMLSFGIRLDFHYNLSAHCLSTYAYFVSCSWTSVYNFHKLNWQSSIAGIYTGCTARSIGRHYLCPCTIS